MIGRRIRSLGAAPEKTADARRGIPRSQFYTDRKKGVYHMQWLNYELPLGLSITTEEHAPLLADYVAHGFRHFELQMPTHILPVSASPAEMLSLIEPNRTRLAQLGLCPWSLHLPFGKAWDIAARDEAQRQEGGRKLAEIIRSAKDWGARVLTLHPGLEPVLPEDRPIRALRSARSVRELRDVAAPLGLQIALEDLPRSCLGNTGEELEAILDAAPGVGCCFDVNHLLQESHADFLARLAPRIIQTHLSDYDGVDERHWLPGRGIVPFGLIAETLQQSGYRGPYLFELRDIFDAETVVNAFRESLNKR